MKTKSLIWCSLALICTWSCGKNHQNKNKSTKEVPVYVVKQKDTLVTNQFVTDIQAKRNVEIRSRLSGIIQKI